MMIWNEHDFVEAFGVLPYIGEYENEYVYTVEKEGLKLQVAVFPYTGDVYIELFREGTEAAVFSTQILNCPVARYVKYQNGMEYIEFATGGFSKGYDDGADISEGVRVGVNPHIRIQCFDER